MIDLMMSCQNITNTKLGDNIMEQSSKKSNEEKIVMNGLLVMVNSIDQILKMMHQVILFRHQNQHTLMQDHLEIIKRKSKCAIDSIQFPLSWIQLATVSENKKLFCKFILKIFELLGSFKQKLMETAVLKPLLVYEFEIEKALSRYNDVGSLAKVMVNVFKIFLTFYEDIKQTTQEHYLTITSKQINPIKADKKFNTVYRSFFIETEPQKRIKKEQIIKKTQLCRLNQSFTCVKQLDLDYSYYRTTYFDVKSNFNLFNEYMRRNKQIKSGIQQYRKLFYEYAKKKEKKRQPRQTYILKKKKQKQNRSANLISPEKEIREMKIEKANFSQLLSDEIIREKQFTGQKKEHRSLYKVKNMMMTTNSIKTISFNKMIRKGELSHIQKNKDSVQIKFNCRKETPSLIQNFREILKKTQLHS